MNLDVAKRNRLNGKFNFKLRDWQFELDGIDDYPPIPFKSARPKRPKVVWERDAKQRFHASCDEQDA